MTARSNGSGQHSAFSRNAASFIVFQGYVVRLGKTSMVNSPRSGLYPVKWKDDRLPKDVKMGSYVTLFGQLITYNLGRTFVVIKTVSLRSRSMRNLKKHINDLLAES
jgi:hypothetical protein